MSALRTSPRRREVTGITAIAGGTAAMRTQPSRTDGSGLRIANARRRPLSTPYDIPRESRNPRASEVGEIPENPISVRENDIATTSAIWEISRENAGYPPVASPTMRPDDTMSGKLRQGRITARGRGPSRKRLTGRAQRVAISVPVMQNPTATFCARDIRSSIHSRRKRIATTGYIVMRGTTTARGPRPIARNIVTPDTAQRTSVGCAPRPAPPRTPPGDEEIDGGRREHVQSRVRGKPDRVEGKLLQDTPGAPEEDGEEHRREPGPAFRLASMTLGHPQEERAGQEEHDAHDLDREERRTEPDDGRGDRHDGVRRAEPAHDGRVPPLDRDEPEERAERTREAGTNPQEHPVRSEVGPSGLQEEPARVDRDAIERIQGEH